MNNTTLDDTQIIKLGKNLWYKTKCFFNHHVWQDQEKDFNYSFRSCIYCGKQQYREISQIRKGAPFGIIIEWKDVTLSYETDTQKIHKLAEKLSKDAADVANELSKFDMGMGQKTKTFMHLVNDAKRLSKKFMDLKVEIRKLHIKKQNEKTHYTEKEENNES